MTSTVSATSLAIAQMRYWYWRGWRIRYWVLPAAEPSTEPVPPVLMLHGFGASLNQWRDNFSELARHRPVYALDLLGFGDSEKASTVFGADLWSAQVHDFWETWIGCPVVLVGHSLGGLVALNNAVTYPEMVQQLVLLTLPAAREELLTGWIEQVSRNMERLFSTPLLIRPLFQFVRQSWVIRGVLRSLYRPLERVDAELVCQYVKPTHDRGAARTLCYLVKSRTELQFTPRTKTLIAQLNAPTLLLWGALDKVIPLSWGKQIAPLNPLVTFQVLPNVGHCAFDEEPTQINRMILDWLQEYDALSLNH